MSRTVRVLVVDDLVSFQRAAGAVVAVADGFALEGTAGSGEEALEFLDRTAVDLVLMDVSMPGMGGVEASLRIRDRHPQVVVLLLSVNRADELPGRLRERGIAFCAKEAFGPEPLEAQWRAATTGDP
jgi:two-component system, NarL family, invasion response regulator UvrY